MGTTPKTLPARESNQTSASATVIGIVLMTVGLGCALIIVRAQPVVNLTFGLLLVVAGVVAIIGALTLGGVFFKSSSSESLPACHNHRQLGE